MLVKTQAVAEVRNSNMEQKPVGDPAPPTNANGDGSLLVPIQESRGAEQQDKLPASFPMIVLPQDPVSTSAIPASGDPLMSNTDFVTLKQFVDGKKSSEGQNLELSSDEIVK